MKNPIFYDEQSKKYVVWLSFYGLKYMRRFENSEDAIEYIKSNPKKIFYESSVSYLERSLELSKIAQKEFQNNKRRDVFICHSSDDKKDIVYPLCKSLKRFHITFWLDEAEIKWGDSVVEKVNEGLKNSDYVLVILTKSFIEKKWVFRELNSSLNIEASTGKIKVLPLIAGNDEVKNKILEELPILNDKVFLEWNQGADEVALKLSERLNPFRKAEIFKQYGFVGFALGSVVSLLISEEWVSFYLLPVLLFIFFSLYGYVIKFLGLHIKNARIKFRSFNKKEIKRKTPSLLLNVIALPVVGGVIGDFLYQTFSSTLAGCFAGFTLSIFTGFKTSSVVSAMIWATVGVFIGMQYGDGNYENLDRMRSYGVLGAIIGTIFSISLGMLVGLVKGVIGTKQDESEETDIEDVENDFTD